MGERSLVGKVGLGLVVVGWVGMGLPVIMSPMSGPIIRGIGTLLWVIGAPAGFIVSTVGIFVDKQKEFAVGGALFGAAAVLLPVIGQMMD